MSRGALGLVWTKFQFNQRFRSILDNFLHLGDPLGPGEPLGPRGIHPGPGWIHLVPKMDPPWAQAWTAVSSSVSAPAPSPNELSTPSQVPLPSRPWRTCSASLRGPLQPLLGSSSDSGVVLTETRTNMSESLQNHETHPCWRVQLMLGRNDSDYWSSGTIFWDVL